MVTTAARHVEIEELWECIAIRPPYFAIEGLSLDPSGVLSAQVPVQHEMGQEAGSISAAEVGRHLAVLGLCSVALQGRGAGKHYYLAQRAHLTRRDIVMDASSNESLIGLAWPIAVDKRSAIARTQLLSSNQMIIYDLTVRYAVVAERLFERLFQEYRQQNTSVLPRQDNPYSHSLPLKNVKITGKRLTAVLVVESPEQCLGHFPNYPAIPVAILMQALAQASCLLVQTRLEIPIFSYVVSDAEVRAENLAFTDEEVDLVVDYLHRLDHVHILSCSAKTHSQKEVGHLEITLQECASTVKVGENPSSLKNAGVTLS